MTDDERAKWQAQVADLAARCAVLKQERDDRDAEIETVNILVQQVQQERDALKDAIDTINGLLRCYEELSQGDSPIEDVHAAWLDLVSWAEQSRAKGGER